METTFLLYKMLVFDLFHFFVLMTLLSWIKNVLDSKEETFPQDWRVSDMLFNCIYRENESKEDFIINAISPDRKTVIASIVGEKDYYFEFQANSFYKLNRKNGNFYNVSLKKRIDLKEQERLSENLKIWSYVNNFLNE